MPSYDPNTLKLTHPPMKLAHTITYPHMTQPPASLLSFYLGLTLAETVVAIADAIAMELADEAADEVCRPVIHLLLALTLLLTQSNLSPNPV